MTLQELIATRRTTASIKRAGHWRIEREMCDPFVGPEFSLWHYSTRMLHWIDYPNGAVIVSVSLGHGSVSDQQGLNRAFMSLRIPLYYSRKGGAGFIGPDHSDYPSHYPRRS